MIKSIRVVRGLAAANVLAWLVHAGLMLAANSLVNRGHSELTLVLPLLLVDLVARPALLLALAAAVIWAMVVLLRQPGSRPTASVVLTIIGTAVLALCGWVWYWQILVTALR